MKNIIIHSIYIFIIITITVVSNYRNFISYYFNQKKDDYIKINTNLNLINPNNNEIIGYLKQGIILKSPDLNDLDDCDLGDNDRYKLLINLENVERNDRIYINKKIKSKDVNLEELYSSVQGSKE